MAIEWMTLIGLKLLTILQRASTEPIQPFSSTGETALGPIEFHIEPVAEAGQGRAWRRDERSTFVVPR